MKYLRKFETEADVNMSVVPNVVLVGDTGKVIYNVLNGVYIQHINGTLYTTDEWTAGGFANDQANGVAVGEGAVKFVIAKEDVSTSMKWTSIYATTFIDGVFIADSKETAITDYAGASNTVVISDADSESAAAACKNYAFPNGKNGYLAAEGEWLVVAKNKSKINSALTLIGGTSFPTNAKYCSSTQYGETTIWVWQFSTSSNGISYDWKTNNQRVRAFTAL